MPGPGPSRAPGVILLLPPTTYLAGMALPDGLARSLGRADRVRGEPGEDAQLARYVRAVPQQCPSAPLSRLLDAGEDDARSHAWVRADPAHIRPDINGARLLGVGPALGLGRADVDALLPALRPVFGDAGFALDAPDPSRWYLRVPRGTPLPEFAPPRDALGDDVFEHLPHAPDARRWRALSSEAQVVLHNHPHNAARLAAGKVPVNALWLWGGGVLPDAVTSDCPSVGTDDLPLRGLARLGKMPCMPLDECDAASTEGLVDLRGSPDAVGLVHRWLVPAAASATRREVVMDFADGTVFRLRPAHRWRAWRRPLPMLAP